MKALVALSAAAALSTSIASAHDDLSIVVPDGWTATETGIAKGNNTLSVGPVVDLGGATPAAYLTELAEIPLEGMEITSVGETKDGDKVVQVTREVVQNGTKARSTLFICKGGHNENRLLELLTDDVFAIISGGKAAIDFCNH